MYLIFAQVKHPKARVRSKYNRTNTDPSLSRLRLFTSELLKPPISLYRVTPGVLAKTKIVALFIHAISQNLAHLEANSNNIIKSHRIFRPSYNTFYEEININHSLLFLSQASYI